MTMRKGEKTTEELQALSDDQIDYSDIPPLPDEFWEQAEVVTPEKRAKKQLTLRIDMEVYEWFRTQGKGYQTLMNNVLKSYVKAQKQREENGSPH